LSYRPVDELVGITAARATKLQPSATYFASLCTVRFRSNGQYFLYSTRPCFRLLFVII